MLGVSLQCEALESPPHLDCYWVGSLDFNFFGNQGFSIQLNFLQRGQQQPRHESVLQKMRARFNAKARCNFNFNAKQPKTLIAGKQVIKKHYSAAS